MTSYYTSAPVLQDYFYYPDSPYQYYQSQPLTRYGSSGGSSPASSSPDSPIMSYNNYYSRQSPPYEEAIYEGQDSQPGPSSRRHHSTSSRKEVDDSRDWPVYCLYPDCNARPFKRSADLHRHYKNTHAPETAKDTYHCDYQKCVRSREPFHRRDHFRDHLRDYHKEDIQKRGVTYSNDWLEGRNTSGNWWRCPRCLVRVYISRDGYDCPKCNTSCESVRKEKRGKKRRDS